MHRGLHEGEKYTQNWCPFTRLIKVHKLERAVRRLSGVDTGLAQSDELVITRKIVEVVVPAVECFQYPLAVALHTIKRLFEPGVFRLVDERRNAFLLLRDRLLAAHHIFEGQPLGIELRHVFLVQAVLFIFTPVLRAHAVRVKRP